MRHSIMRLSAFALSALVLLMMACCHQSYQGKADKFKQSLSGENIVIAEVIDTTAQKIFYHDTTSLRDDKGNVKNYKLSIYDIATQETSVIELVGLKTIVSAKQYANRLFFSGKDSLGVGEPPTGCLLYYDLVDNSIHYIWEISCMKYKDVTFLDNEILVTLEVAGYKQNIYAHISPNLSDSEYQSTVKKHEQEFDDLFWKLVNEEEERERQNEEWERQNELANSKKIIHIEFDIDGISYSTPFLGGICTDLIPEVGMRMGTNEFTVPTGKQWVCKSLNTAGAERLIIKSATTYNEIGIINGMTIGGDTYSLHFLPTPKGRCYIHIEFEEKPF